VGREPLVSRKAVFDAMVFLQAGANPGGPSGACLDQVRSGSITLITSPDTVAERTSRRASRGSVYSTRYRSLGKSKRRGTHLMTNAEVDQDPDDELGVLVRVIEEFAGGLLPLPDRFPGLLPSGPDH
jgi:hypothetical protein